jgi:hypothetical protein
MWRKVKVFEKRIRVRRFSLQEKHVIVFSKPEASVASSNTQTFT